MHSILSSLSETTCVLLSLSIMLFAGFAMTRVTKRLHLPNVSGYIIAGILIGPNVLNIIPKAMLPHMAFVSDIALMFIAFGVGRFFQRETLGAMGGKVLIITLMESVLSGVIVTFFLIAVFRLSWQASLILGAIATATAPASTMMTIRQYKAKGEFVNILLQVVALDDAVCLLVFGVATAVVEVSGTGSISTADVVLPLVWNVVAIFAGYLCGLGLNALMVDSRTRANRLILAVAMLLGLSGLCSIVNISPLLACMVLGATYINHKKEKKLFKQVDHFSPPIMTLFFVLSGMNLDLTQLRTVGVIGVGYFLIRIAGKYLGAYLGCMMTGTDRKTRNWLGMALIPQAGVSIGLATLTGRILAGPAAQLVNTIILSSAVLYELIGPASAKLALVRGGAIGQRQTEPSEEVPAELSELPTDGTVL